MSLDDLVIASFVSGPAATTLPMAVYSSVRIGVTPEINALATVFLAVVFAVVASAFVLMARQEKRRRAAGKWTTCRTVARLIERMMKPDIPVVPHRSAFSSAVRAERMRFRRRLGDSVWRGRILRSAGRGCSGTANPPFGDAAIASAATAVLLLWAGAAGACDDFADAPSSRWSIAAGEDGPRLLTPCGDPFFSLGVNAIDGGAGAEEAANPEQAYRWQRFAATRAEWAVGARRRAARLGIQHGRGVVGAAGRDRPAEHAGTRTRGAPSNSSGPTRSIRR